VQTTKSNMVSIPQSVTGVNSSEQELMEQFPVQVDTYGLAFQEGCSEEAKIKVCALLIAVNREQMLRTRFRMGDAYNAISGKHGCKRKLICEHFGEQYYHLFRNCGYTAKKWPLHLRTNEHSWDWYTRNSPGVRPKARYYAAQRLTEVARERTPEGEIIYYEAPDGKPFTALTEDEKRLAEERVAYSV
jgi:hypothetical protein